MGLVPSYNYVNTIVWLHHTDSLGEKTRKEQQ